MFFFNLIREAINKWWIKFTGVITVMRLKQPEKATEDSKKDGLGIIYNIGSDE